MVVGPTKQQALKLLYYHFTVDSPTREGKDPDLIPGYRLCQLHSLGPMICHTYYSVVPGALGCKGQIQVQSKELK